MFPGKSITKMSTPTVAKSIEKVVGGILGIDFPGNILMSSDSFQNLQSKMLLNSLRPSISEL
jgi:hypothetical protein